jgi:hypothetical protein
MLKQKDYEYIIKQDKHLESYQNAFGKLTAKYNGKRSTMTTVIIL